MNIEDWFFIFFMVVMMVVFSLSVAGLVKYFFQ
jgi:hypothetical protein